jgi:hypothetical protein
MQYLYNESKNLIDNKKIHMISYGNEKFINSKKRIFNEGINSNFFYSIEVFGPENLDKEFKYKYNNILTLERGGGYWLWKLNIIEQKLKKINDNDYLIYIDSGCTINEKGINRLNEYINMLENSNLGIISFQLGHLEKIWTIKEIFDYFNINNESNILNSGQYMATILIMKKNNHLIKILDTWSNLVNINPLLITDYYTYNNQEEYFKDNRHDQSVLSVIRKIEGSIILDDETYFGDGIQSYKNNANALQYPFWATRIKN